MQSLISGIRRNASPLLFGLVLLICATFAHSQNVRYDGVVQSRSGAPAPGASVAVCAQGSNTSVTPCSVPVALCSSLVDVTCTSPNPVTADGLGNYHFYIAKTTLPVTLQFFGSGLTTSALPDQYLGAAGTSGGSGPTIQVNGTSVPVQNVLNFINTPNVAFGSGGAGQVQASVVGDVTGLTSLGVNAVSDTGSVNAYKACASGNQTNLPQFLIITPANSNTGASTIQVCSNTAVSLFKETPTGAGNLISGDIIASQTMFVLYLQSSAILLNALTTSAGSTVSLQTNSNPNTSQSVLNLVSQNNVGNYGDFFCQNTSGGIVACNVGGIIDLTLNTDGAPGGGMLIASLGPDTGSANAYASCPAGGMTNPQKVGMEVQFVAANTNTGASTFAMCGQTALAIVKGGNAAIVGGDIVANQLVDLEETGTAWQLLNPASTASGTVANQQKGQPTVGNTASTLTTEPATFVAQAFTGADLCAKITAALNSCPTGSTNMCHVIVDATTPGSVDVCGTTTSNFFSGVPTSVLVDLDLRTLLQLKRPLIAPQAAHLVHGMGSSQNQRGSGFIMDPTFSDPGNNCNFVTGTNGPFTTGTYLCLIVDGGGNWANNAFGGKWRDLSLDCNGVTNCIPFYTGNEQEDSGLWHVRVWGLAVNSATSQSACGFWDHSVASGSNSGPSHFTIKDSYCDPWGNGSTGTTTNNTIYGWTYEGNGSGGNITIDGSTVRAQSGTQLMVDGIWIDGSNQPAISNIHCEWMSTDCIALGAGGHGTIAARAMSISDANHSANGVHFYSGSTGGVAMSIQAQGPAIQDDVNSCSVSLGTLEYYTTDSQGEGWWNGGLHSCANANTDTHGHLTLSAGSATYNFQSSYTTAPDCWATDNTATNAVKVSTTTTVLTITGTSTDVVSYGCHGRN